MRVLVVEDEAKVARFIAKGLREENLSVDTAADGEQALDHIMQTDYDLVVLDVRLPKADGFRVLAAMRAAKCRARVLMLTACDGIQDRVRGLDAGADDYLVKPFAFEEFVARVRALLRRERDQDSVTMRYVTAAF